MEASVPKLLSKSQLNWFVVLVYIACLLLALQMALTVYNSYAFLYRQQKFKTVPLLLFYMLTILLTAGRFIYNVMQFGYLFN
jgi:hypothetical protein